MKKKIQKRNQKKQVIEINLIVWRELRDLALLLLFFVVAITILNSCTRLMESDETNYKKCLNVCEGKEVSDYQEGKRLGFSESQEMFVNGKVEENTLVVLRPIVVENDPTECVDVCNDFYIKISKK